MEIVCLQDGNNRTAAYCLPTVAGSVECYFDLVRAIGPGHPVYGIQFADRLRTGKFKEFSSLQEMVAAMVPDLLTHNGDRPICLIGFSFSAFLAIELARQLVGRGKHVPLVAITAERGPSASFTLPFRIKHFIRNVGPFALRAATRAVTDSTYRNAVVHKLRHKLRGRDTFVGASWYESLSKDHQEYVAKNDANLRNYRFEGAYCGKILLFRKRSLPERDAHPLRFHQLKDYGWGVATGASVDVVYTPIDSSSMMQQTDVVHVASALRPALRECDRSLPDR